MKSIEIPTGFPFLRSGSARGLLPAPQGAPARDGSGSLGWWIFKGWFDGGFTWDVMVIEWNFMLIHRDLMLNRFNGFFSFFFYCVLMGLNDDVIGLKGDLMMISWGNQRMISWDNQIYGLTYRTPPVFHWHTKNPAECSWNMWTIIENPRV